MSERGAARFALPVHRNRFLARRGLLRLVLSAYAKIPPAELAFRNTEYGKPELVDSQNHDGLQFNTSHSHGMALVTVSRGRAVGVDVEWIRPLPDLEALIETCLSTDEQRQIAACSGGRRREAFFNCWTCKEAVLKVRGQGLSAPLTTVPLTLDGAAPRVAAVKNSLSNAEKLFLRSLAPFVGFSGAVAAIDAESEPNLKFFRFSGLAVRTSPAHERDPAGN